MHGTRRRPFGLASAVALTLVSAVPGAAGAQHVAAAPSLVLDGVTVVDVELGRLVPDQRVVIVGNRIQSMENTRTAKLPVGARVVSATGKYLIPGLWDMHVHVNLNEPNFSAGYLRFLPFGVTAVREASYGKAGLDSLLRWRRAVASGELLGPRVLFAGAIRGGHHAHNEEEARDLVRAYKAQGADFIKTLRMPREMFFAIAAEARRVGLPFGGHTEGGSVQNRAAIAFIRRWTQRQSREALFAQAAETRRQGGSTGVWEVQEKEAASTLEASDSGATIIDHLNSKALVEECIGPEASVQGCQLIAERFRRNGTWLVPTIGAYSLGGGITRRTAPDTAADSLDLFRIIHRVGFPVMAGSDVGTLGQGLHMELWGYVREGLTPLEALQSATLNPAKYLRGTDSLGTVAPGKLADLVLLDANPLEDIHNTGKIGAVVTNGRYLDRTALDQLSAGVKDQGKAQGPLVAP